jgi:hypothetical protein
MMDPEEEEVLLQARLAKVQEAKREKQQMRDSMQRVVASPHWTFMVTECANNWSDVACFARFVQDEIARGTLKRGVSWCLTIIPQALPRQPQQLPPQLQVQLLIICLIECKFVLV